MPVQEFNLIAGSLIKLKQTPSRTGAELRPVRALS